MLNIVSAGRMFLIGMSSMLMVACSSTSDQEIAASFAEQRADMLKKIIPVHMNGYNLINARADGTQIELTLLYSGTSEVTPQALSESLRATYCSDNEIVSLLKKGVSYRLVFREARGKPIYDKSIGINECSASTNEINNIGEEKKE